MTLKKDDLEEMSDEEIFRELRTEFSSRAEKQPAHLKVLIDREWHCRHEYSHIGSGQTAGGGGIQGLERGTKNRRGYVIKSEKKYCGECDAVRKHDRWTGERKESNTAAGISETVAKKVYEYYNYQDSIEQRERKKHNLIIDHRFPMERWGEAEESLSGKITGEEINRKFQLLKDDGDSNHNLLKSRQCERCIKTGIRGTPLGIEFWYEGGPEWPEDVPEKGPEAEKGCVGCGWYDFNKWRNELKSLIKKHADFDSEIEIDLDHFNIEDRSEEQVGLNNFTD